MGMTIDDAIETIEYLKIQNSQLKSLDIAIDTMRKYQKIEHIINKWNVGIYDDEGLCDAEVLEMISVISDEVENGNESSRN